MMQNADASQLQSPVHPTAEPPSKMMPKLMKRAWNLILTLLELPFRYLFGRDLFISYSRSDSRKYAPNLALELQRRMPKLSFYLDRWIAPPSGELPISLKLQLRWSSIMVVICTDNAIRSNFVKDEVARFATLGRKVLTVDVNGAFNAVRTQSPWSGVSGADPEEESNEAIQNGHPSEHVMERILKMVEFTTQERRLRRAVWGTLILVVLSIGGTAAYSAWTVKDAEQKRTLAEEQAKAAEDRANGAQERANEAAKSEASAKKAQDIAERKATEASDKAQAAEKLRTTAEAKAGEALEKERNARAEAARQQNIATAGRLAAENILVPEPILEQVEKKVLFTIESLKLAPSSIAYRNLVEGIKMVPRVLDRATHDGPVTDLFFTVDGKRVVILAGNSLSLRSADELSSTGKLGPPQKISGTEQITLAKLSRDGRYLAAASKDRVQLWRADTMMALPSIEQKDVRAIAFSEDGELIAIGSARFTPETEGLATVWRLGETYTELAHLSSPVGVLDVSFSRDKLRFTTLSEYGLQLWNTNAGSQSIPPARGGADTLRTGGFSPNGKYLFTTGVDDRQYGTVQHADTRKNVFSNQLDFVEFSPDGRFLVTTSSDDETEYRQVQIRDAFAEELNLLSQIPYRSIILNGRFSRDGKLLALVSQHNKTAEVWDTLTGRLLTSVKLKNTRGRLAFSPDGKYFAAAAGTEVTIWPLGEDSKAAEISHAEGPTSISADGRHIAVANGAKVSILNSSNGSEFSSIDTRCEVGSLTFDWQGKRVATAGRDCGISVWEIGDTERYTEILHKEITSFDISGLIFSRDGRELITATDNGVPIYNIASPSRFMRVGKESASSVAVSADGRRIATVDSDKISVWDRSRPNDNPKRITFELQNSDSNELSVAFDEDGHLVVADDYNVRILDISRTEVVQVGGFVLQTGSKPDVKSTILSPNGAFVAKTGGIGRKNILTSVWPLNTTALIITACSRLSTPLSLEDWQDVFGSKKYHETCPGLKPSSLDNDQ